MRGGVRGKEIISSSVRIMFVSFLKRKRDRDLPSKQLCPTCVKYWITLGPSSSFEYVLGSVFESVYVCVCVLQWPGCGFRKEKSGVGGGTLAAKGMLMYEDSG